MSNLKTSNVQIGQNATSSQNFTLRTNADGTFRISRGELGALLGDVLTINADGTVTGNIIAGLGVGQTWQNLSGSRSLGTTYYNTTGKPIQIEVNFNATSANAAASITVGGVVAASTTIASWNQCLTVCVPAGATYVASSASVALKYWAELR